MASSSGMAFGKCGKLADLELHSTTAGGDLSDKEDMATECSEASLLSSCLSSAQRSSGRKEKKRIAYLARSKAMKLAQGDAWTDPTARD